MNRAIKLLFVAGKNHCKTLLSQPKRSIFGSFGGFWRMPPVVPISVTDEIRKLIKENNVMVFSKTTCPFCIKVKDLLNSEGIDFKSFELDKLENTSAYQDGLVEISGQRSVPNVFISGQHLGGCDATIQAHAEKRLLPLVQQGKLGPHSFDYDLIVIGGGSGGLAASKEAASKGFKVACLDFVKPSPQGTTWGLGGTCVNVGCIPKKLMHQAAILGDNLNDAKSFGWDVPDGIKHDWTKMKNAIQDHIASLNWGYRVSLREKSVTYMNAFGEFIGPNKIKTTNKKGKVTEMTSKYFIIATGGRPKYPDIPGCKEYCISSDDLFSLPHSPGKTLVIGASYVALECAGFLAAMGFETTVMVRSILLRGFDQQCAELIGQYMTDHNVNFLRSCVPTKIVQVKAPTDTQPGEYKVTGKQANGKEVTIECNTVLMAVGRDPCTTHIGLDKVDVKTNKSGFIIVDDCEKTSSSYIYAVGDAIADRPELTPVAIQAGKLLAQRLFADSAIKTDYISVPTTVFTPLEYGSIGLSEEAAENKYGDDLEVYHTGYIPLEWTVAHREENACYAKLICVKSMNERVVGMHLLGPNAGEITQGFALGVKLGATKSDFDRTIGIHPTCAEVLTTLKITKRSGMSASGTGC